MLIKLCQHLVETVEIITRVAVQWVETVVHLVQVRPIKAIINIAMSQSPEPIPAFLVSSAEKDWLTISPYAVKFWDKLNLEPYSKQKNISYIVLVPDFESDIYDNFNYSSLGSKQQPHQSNEETDYLNYFIKNTTSGTSGAKNNRSNKLPSQSISNSINEINQSIKEYFKELTSVYELCRLGLHRPALRIAPDHGFVKVPLLLNNKKTIWQVYFIVYILCNFMKE